ncbi:hypothetical protein BDB00DRAFT_868338 [Zychaea mexicana]|uniref:uncharacterized protein n=1 Tax=Zychaea mexicana TaxID=64656 RepID=UPI0022FEF48D|nr:uncharacterized protein BDB00DRAFT_868338 [Zychaea mexicana]KAI9497734.1 hypothetical protein BDB00DRAFT_868338 [Zychaea mexicana]
MNYFEDKSAEKSQSQVTASAEIEELQSDKKNISPVIKFGKMYQVLSPEDPNIESPLPSPSAPLFSPVGSWASNPAASSLSYFTISKVLSFLLYSSTEI